MRLETAVDQFISERRLGTPGKSRPLGIATQRRCKASLDSFTDWVRVTRGRSSVLFFTAQLVRDYITFRSERDLAPNTLSIDCAALREFAKWGARKRYWSGADLEELPQIAKPKGSPRALLPEHRDKVMALELEGADAVLRGLLYYVGGRGEEILGIRQRDVRPPHELPDGTSLVGTVRLYGKGAKDRTVGIHHALWAVLAPHIAKMQGEPLDCPLLHRDGRPWTKAMLYRRVKHWAEAAGIEPFTPHGLRQHVRDRPLLDADVDLRAIQRLLGHARLSTTEIYTRVSDRRTTNAVMRLPVFERLPFSHRIQLFTGRAARKDSSCCAPTPCRIGRNTAILSGPQ